jgi:hypothetical protein
MFLLVLRLHFETSLPLRSLLTVRSLSFCGIPWNGKELHGRAEPWLLLLYS